MRRIGLAAAATAILATAFVFAWAAQDGEPDGDAASPATANWPQWLGPARDGISKETGLLAEWPADGPAKLWSKPVGRGYASPVAIEGKVLVFSTVNRKDTLNCLAADDGQELWSKSYDNSWTGQYPGTRATPTVDGELVYTYGGAGDLVCRKLADGQEVWKLDVMKETGASKNLKWGLASSPTIVGDVLYVQSGEGGSVALAVNKKTGKVVWKSQGKGMASYAAVVPIAVGDSRQLVVFAGKGVVGVEAASGQTLWTEPWQTSWDVHAATPIFRDGHLFITSGYNHGCMMLKFDAAKPTRLWEKKEPHCRFPAPILDGDHLYVNSEGTLMCLSWPDGKELWKSGALGLGIGGSFVRAGDRLIALSENGRLSLATATPNECKVISKMQLFRGGEHWATPLIYRGRLYVKGGSELVCLDIKAK